MIGCPNCGTAVQADASFCGQCGFNMQAAATSQATPPPPPPPDNPLLPDLVPPDPLIEPEPVATGQPYFPVESGYPTAAIDEPDASATMAPREATPPISVEPPPLAPPPPPPASEPPPPPVSQPISQPAPVASSHTQLQVQTAQLLHVQSNTLVELSPSLSVIHVGKPNDRIPPDIDLSGFPNSEIVSRIHADIRVEGDAHYLEDVGSSNGTYVNNILLPMGNRHRLRAGDRISFGKGDLVSFLFQTA